MSTPCHNPPHDVGYERKTLILLALGFGLVALDRWMIAPLFPYMMKDLHLSYQDLGTLTGILGIAWGICSTLMGRISDRFGRKQIMVVAMVVFSLLSSFSGVAGGFTSLLLIRGVMGLAEGAFLPTSVAAVGEAAHPTRRGLNQGLQMSMFALMGFGLAPIVATQLLRVVPSWHWVFAISAVPGLILAFLIATTLRNTGHPGRGNATQAVQKLNWSDLLRSRNVIVAMLAMLSAMAGIFVIGAMVPSYLVDYLHLAPQKMGLVLSAIGIGGFFGEVCLPGISDFVGRRITTVAAFVFGGISLHLFARIGAKPVELFAALSVLSFFALGLTALITGPIATEAAPPGLIASAIGIASGAGEIFGGGVAPTLAGWVAQHYGIQYTLTFALGGLTCGAVVALFLRETAPRLVARSGGRLHATHGPDAQLEITPDSSLE